MGSGHSQCRSARNVVVEDRLGGPGPEVVAEVKFPQFGFLSDDVAIEILSFLSSGPYEGGADSPRGSLTHVLPLVCRRFRDFCRTSDLLWMLSLERLVTRDPDAWDDGVHSILSSVRSIPLPPSTIAQVYGGGDCGNSKVIRGMFDRSQGAVEGNGHENGGRLQTMTRDEVRQLLQIVCKVARQQMSRREAAELTSSDSRKVDRARRNRFGGERFCPSRVAYVSLVRDHMSMSMPVFYMPSPYVGVGRLVGLHFFEPRYCRLIAEVTAGRTTNELRGGPLRKPHPQFVYACNAPLAAGTDAFIVEINRCRIHPDGRADILIYPVRRVRLEKVEERSGTDGLCDVMFKRL